MLWSLAALLAIDSANLASAREFPGVIEPAHPNAILQEPQTVASFYVSADENQKARQERISWRLVPNSIRGPSGKISVPDAVSNANEFDLGLVDPTGKYWPLTNPLAYRTNEFVYATNLRVSDLMPLRREQAFGDRSNTTVLDSDQLTIATISRLPPSLDLRIVELRGAFGVCRIGT